MANEANNQDQAPVEAGQAPEVMAGENEQELSPSIETDQELPEKYQGKSAAEIAKMHMEAEKLATQRSQEAADIKKVLEEMRNPQQSEPTIPEQQQIDPEKYVRDLIRRETQPLQVNLEVAEVEKNNSDFNELKPDIIKVLQENPSLGQPGGLKLALEIARGRKTQHIAQQARQEGRKEGAQTEVKKQSAFVEGAGRKKVGTPQLNTDTVSKMSARELEEFLPKI